jgi:hypothetical protein
MSMTSDRPVPSPVPPRLANWVRVADVVTLAALGLWCRVFFGGGFKVVIAGVRVALYTHWRILVLAVIVALARHALVKRPPFFAWLPHDLRDWARTTDVIPDVAAPRRWWEGAWGALLIVSAIWALMTWPQVTGMTTLVNDPGDPYMKVWQLDWVAHQLLRAPSHLYDANIFYPETGVLAYTDALIAPALVSAPFIWLGVSPIVVFNVLLALGFILSGVAMFGLVRSLTGNWPAAIFAGLAFSFLPYRFNHYAHLELQFTWGIPLAMWVLHRVYKFGRLRDGLLLGLIVGVQALCSFYYGVFLGVFLAVVGPILWCASPCRGKSVRALAVGVAVATVCVLPAILPHVISRSTVGERGIIDVRVYSARPGNYLAPDANNRLYNPLLSRRGIHELRLFPGFLLMALGLVGLWPLRSANRLAYLIGAVLAFDASLGANGYVYRVLWELVPPMRGLRVPARFGLLTGFSLAVLAGYGVARLATWTRWKPGRLMVTVALVAVMLAEYRSFPLPLFEIPSAVPEVYSWLAGQPRSVVAELPVSDDADFRYMYGSRFHWQPLLNGQSGFFPTWYYIFQWQAERFPDPGSVAFLKSRGVRFVVLHERTYLPHRRDVLYERLAAYTNLVREVKSFQGDAVRVVEIR